jgi:YidC/Oxa1 family membrane protein insertase
MDKRTILAIVLACAVVMVYQMFFVRPVPRQPVPPELSDKNESIVATPVEKAPQAPTPALDAKVALSPKPSVPAQDITVETPLYSAVFTTQGAALKAFKLKNYRQTLKADSPLINLVDVKEGMNLPLVLTFPGSNVMVSPDDMFQADSAAVSLAQDNDAKKLTFSISYPQGVQVEKIFTFYADRYRLDLDVRVFNATMLNLKEKGQLTWHQYVDPKAEEDGYGHTGPVYQIKTDVETLTVGKMESSKIIGPEVSWGAFESKYFIAALISKQPALTNLVLAKDPKNLVYVSLDGPSILVPTGQSSEFSYSLYLGPKDHDILKAEGVGLENAIDFGSWIKWLALPLLITLNFIYKFVHNYGVAIIILTIIIKIFFWPLGTKSYKSMKDMQKIQPLMNELKTKYKDDKQRMNQEVMQLYKTHKVNPLGGCLPMLLQIPVFFGLYKALLYAIELRHQPFVWWIQDLSAKDPYYITPIVMGATMVLQQKMTPAAGDPMQQKLMMIMPIVFTFLFLNFPSGLVIYWLFNNILSIGQQYYINKSLN